MYNLEEITKQVKEVIDYSQGYTPAQEEIDKLIQTWEHNKGPIINKFFKGDLIYELPVKQHFRLGETARKHLYSNFLDYVCLRLNNYSLCRFLEDQGIDAFFNNVVEHEYNYGDISIPKDSKVVRSFKFFIDDKDLLTKAQNEASRVIQNDGIEGILGISVHPLDYLSLSENTYNWRSCHALDGEYRAGNLSYMMDSNTIICYLRGDGMEKLPNFPDDVLWHSKKWRCLGFLSDDLKSGIMMGRPYPYPAADILEYLRTKVFNDTWDLNFTHWHDDAIDQVENRFDTQIAELNAPYVPVCGELVNLKSVIHDCDSPTHYNDLLNSSIYNPIYSFRRSAVYYSVENFKKIQYHIGNPVSCLICGQDYVGEGDSTMLCRDCNLEYGEDADNIVYCNHCGRRIYYDDACVVNDNDYVCAECFDKIADYCDVCGCAYYINDLREIKNEKGEVKKVCEWCERELKDGAAPVDPFAITTFGSDKFYIKNENDEWVPLSSFIDIDDLEN